MAWRTRVKVSGPMLDAAFTLPMSKEHAVEMRQRFRTDIGVTAGAIPAWRAYGWLKRHNYYPVGLPAVEKIRLAVWLTRSWVV